MVEIEIAGLGIETLPGLHIASLRYFDSAGDFSGLVRQLLGTALPQVGQAVRARASAEVLEFLLWRGPTETWLVSADGALIGTLATALAAARDGCMVDQTGGICVLRLRGARATDLLLRLGSAAIPAAGQARTGRVAELTVTTLSIQAGETLLLVERAYADHLRAWMRATAADL